MSVKHKHYLILALFNMGLLLFSGYISGIFWYYGDNWGLVVYGALWMAVVVIFEIVYGICSCIYTKRIILPQLMLLGNLFICFFCVFTADKNEGFSLMLDTFFVTLPFMLFSLIPALITKLIVKLVEYKKSRNITPSPDQPQQ